MTMIDRLIREGLGLYRVRPMRPLLDATLPRLPLNAPRAALVAYQSARLRAASGEESAALATLIKASDRGLWWAPELMLSEPGFEAVRHHAQFERLLARCSQLRASARQPLPGVLVAEPPEDPRALMLVLHARNGRADATAAQWRVAATLGCRVVVPDSGQRFGMDTFCWDDTESALRRVGELLKAKVGDRAGGRPVVMAGFSQGAALAIWLVLSGRIEATRFVAINPSFVTTPPVYPLLLRSTKLQNVRGRMLVGEHDPGFLEASGLSRSLAHAGLDVGLTAVPGLGHEMPGKLRTQLAGVLRELAVTT